MREFDASLQQFGEFLLNARLVSIGKTRHLLFRSVVGAAQRSPSASRHVASTACWCHAVI